MRRPFRPVVLLVAGLSLIAAACGDDDDNGSAATTTATTEAATTTERATTTTARAATTTTAGGTTTARATTTAAPTTTTTPPVTGEVKVLAAASLTNAFDEIGAAFTAKYPGTSYSKDYRGSSALAAAINEGIPSDVFVSADLPNMAKVTDAGNTRTPPQIIATNVLEIAVQPGNPEGITGLTDLDNGDLDVVLCQVQVPCGNFAHQILDRAGVEVTPVSEEPDVRAVLTKIEEQEADAGIVYVTDVRSASDRVTGVEIPREQNAVAEYPIVITKESGNPAAAAAFVAFVAGAEGQAILRKYGFGAP